MSVKRRILSGALANAAGIGMGAVLQFISVPVLVSAWGPEKYGLWLMLTTVPTYFALTDLGFVQAATSEMTMQVANGERTNALAVFQSSTLLVALMCASAVGVLLCVVRAAGDSGYLPSWVDSQIVTLLCLFAASSLLSRMSLAALRATGNYEIGTLCYDGMVMVEGLAALLTAYLGGDFFEVVFCLFSLRVVNILLIYIILRHKVPWLYFGFTHLRTGELKRLIKPAIAGMTIPIALAVNLQGVVLIVGAILSPAAVAAFAAVRTCSRLMIQVIGVVNRATMPEAARAFALSDGANTAAVLRINGLMIGGILVPGAVLFAIFGKSFVEVWSAGGISPSVSFVGLMAIAVVVHGAWYFLSNILLATNSHVAMAKYILFASFSTVAMVYIFCSLWGINGAAVGLIAGELFCFFVTFREFRSNDLERW